MEKLTRILVIADRSPADRMVLLKGVGLARAFGAQIEIYACDPERPPELRGFHDTAEAEKAWVERVEAGTAYLQALRSSVPAPDVHISVDCTCDSRVPQAVARKIESGRPDLVMKRAASAHPGRFALGASDWDLMRTCPVSLMLTREKPWKEPARFAAMVDMLDPETPSAAKEVMHAAEYLTCGWGADLDVVFCERDEPSPDRASRAQQLAALAREHRVLSEHVHILLGEPDEVLPQFASRSGYDVVVLGTLTHRKRLASLVGRLTGRFADALDCDLLLVKPVASAETWSTAAVLQAVSGV